MSLFAEERNDEYFCSPAENKFCRDHSDYTHRLFYLINIKEFRLLLTLSVVCV
jgi:hypothetical protein